MPLNRQPIFIQKSHNYRRKTGMSIQPEGEDLRKAIRWIFQERQCDPGKNANQLAEEACIMFDLSPKDALFLTKTIQEEKA